ncbi:MAG: nucleoside hydrolase [Erysipelotrichales bacterium]|nr:nucleoside hydrolase [Erysipelotrichales bacterium]
MEKNPIPLILDTDPGVDDFFCLAVVCAHPDVFSLRAVTSVGGNNSTDVTTKNAMDILALFHHDAPVFRGSDRYLTEEFGEPVVTAHGTNGLAEQILPDSKRVPGKEKAWDAICRIALEEQGNLELLTVGPLTNIAIAFLKYPSLSKMIRRITMMGGTNFIGNIGPYAEANIGHDAMAARIVFESEVPVHMVGLDSTVQCPVPLEEFEKMSVHTDPFIRETMRELIRFRKGEAMHDAVAAACMIDPDIVSWKTADVTVEVNEGLTKGMTVIFPDENGNDRVAHNPVRERYLAVFEKTVQYYREGFYESK